MKHTYSRTGLQKKLLAAAIATCFGGAQGAPTLPQVVAGQAAFSQNGNVFSITNTPNTIINWQSFSIGRDEITRFIQQNSDSRVLNRITGQDPSSILGALQSNGKVYLINPNGILFGKDARIDVNGLVASSLNLTNGDFLAGKHVFQGGGGTVVNQGSITTPQGGQVYLVAPSVENTGIIHAPNGDVLLAAGRSVQLVDSSDPSVHVVVSAPDDRALNLGNIVAAGGRVGIYGALLNQRGTVNADSAVVGANGRIVLKASRTALLEGGSVTTATGAGTGGTIEVRGGQVGLTGNASVDASGAQGGGTVLLGGDVHGAGGNNARQVFVGREATIAADASAGGDGGKVVAWGDETARVQGAISVRGAGAGHGGFVETSGHYLDVAGVRVNAAGPAGNGQWLLDPFDIDVKAAPAGAAGLGDVADFNAGAPTGVTEIGTALINNATANVTLQARHDLTVSDAIDIAAAGVGFTAQAGHHVAVNAAITTQGGNVTLSANDLASGAADGTGELTVNGGIATHGGDVVLRGAAVTVGGAVDGANVTLQSNVAGKQVQLAAAATVRADNGLVSFMADDVKLAGHVDAGADGYVSFTTTTAGRGIVLGSDDTVKLGLTQGELDNVTAYGINVGTSAHAGGIEAPTAITVHGAGALALESQGGISISAPVTMQAAGSAIYVGNTAATGKVTLLGAGLLQAGQVYVRSDNVDISGALTIAATNAYFDTYSDNAAITVGQGAAWLNAAELGAVRAPGIAIGTREGYAGNVTVNALDVTGSSGAAGVLTLQGGAVAIDGAVTVPGTLALHATAGGITQTGAINAATLVATGGSVTLAHAGNAVQHFAAAAEEGDIVLHTGGTLQVVAAQGVQGIATAGNVTLEAAGGITQAGDAPISAAALTLDAASGTVVLSHTDNRVQHLDATARALDFHTSGDLAIGAINQSASAGGAAVFVAADGQLDIDRIHAPGSPVLLRASDIAVATEGSITADTVAFVARAGRSIHLGGTGASGGDGESAGMWVTSDELGRITANTVYFDAAGTEGYGGYGGAVYIDNLTLADATIGALSARAYYGMTLTGTNTLPATALHLWSRQDIINDSVLQAKAVVLAGTAIDLRQGVTAEAVTLRSSSAGQAITVGAECVTEGCLALTQLAQVDAATVHIGAADGGAISVAGVGTTAGATQRHAATRQLILHANGDVTQTGAIDVRDLGIDLGIDLTSGAHNVTLASAGNMVRNLAVRAEGDVVFHNGTDLAITRLAGGNAALGTVFALDGVQGAAIDLALAGSLTTTNTTIAGGALHVLAAGSIGMAGAPLATQVALLDVESTATGTSAPINIVNNSAGFAHALTVHRLQLALGNGGSITLNNYGATTVDATGLVQSDSGDIAITAHSPLTIDGTVAAQSGNIALVAGSSGSADDKLVLGSTAQVSSASGNITLAAGDAITVAAGAVVAAPAGTVSSTPNANTPTPPVPTPPVPTPPVPTPPVPTPPVPTPPVPTPPVPTPPVPTPPVPTPPVPTPPVPTPPVPTPPVPTPPVPTPPVPVPPVPVPPVPVPPVPVPPVPTPPVPVPPVPTPPVPVPPVPTPPPSADICTIAPNSALCQVLSPPTASEPVKPVQVAAQEIIKAVQRDQLLLAAATLRDDKTPQAEGAPEPSGGGGNTRPDDKKSDGKAVAQPGTEHDKPILKNFCN